MALGFIQAALLALVVFGGVLASNSRGRVDGMNQATKSYAKLDKIQKEMIKAQEDELKALRETVAIYKAAFDNQHHAADPVGQR